ncbi:hypothetical protein QYN14_10005 [Rhodococcus ruber]|uniref:hypothetical protein n=1 Tax=Rhodococcus ruber TaxID=1830 RepID=UPI00265AF775|nr:hypothetical protein [Rhodococcus ruber]WKK13871.1 hypothetical protein QYN14_10005 [Rhodococcus ruber]
MTTTHFAIGRARSKRPPRRCLAHRCPVLTRHRSQRCPDHRGRPARPHNGTRWREQPAPTPNLPLPD